MLKHYGMYLNSDDPDDAELIAVLDRYVRSRRVGEFLRAASLDKIKPHSVAASTFTPYAPAYAPVVPAAGSLAAPETVVQKARKAFFK